MNTIAARERFFVPYREQDRLSNVQGRWNWYDTRTGRAWRIRRRAPSRPCLGKA
jgi:poly(3-hydroxybutyrate) depolymerase